jgi:phosphoribosylglycinamide formyltransferase-1
LLSRRKGDFTSIYQLDSKPFERVDRLTVTKRLIKILEEYDADFIVLARYMRILSPNFVWRYPNRIINIHPSLLPAFPGLESWKQALAYGVKIAGCTVHFVDAGVDAGPVILQAAVPVLDDDTHESLHQRIHDQEHRIYPEAIRLIAEGKIGIEGRRVLVHRG